MVRDRCHLPPFLQWPARAKCRQEQAPVCITTSAVRSLVGRVRVRCHYVCAFHFPSFLSYPAFMHFCVLSVTNWSQQFSAWEVFLRDEWSTVTFVTNYLPIMLFPVLYVSAKVTTGVPLVRANEMDFKSGTYGIDAVTSVFVLLVPAFPI